MNFARLVIFICLIVPFAFLFLGQASYENAENPPKPLVIEKIVKEPYFLGEQPVFVEINQIPPPFDLAGNDPYIVWVNGARVHLPKEYIEPIIEKIGKENIKPIDIMNLHDGWINPHFFEQPQKVVYKGRTRSLNDKQRTQ